MSKEPDDTTAEAPHTIDGSNRVAEFERHRRLLFSIAYRMLGSVADAEDILQDAFIRCQRASKTEVKSPKAFLITVVSRLCISHLQSARARREEYVGEWLPEPLATGVENQPSRIVQVDESVSMALLLLLERLTPVERGGLSASGYLRLHTCRDCENAGFDGSQLPAAAASCAGTCPPGPPALQSIRKRASRGARTLSGGCGQRQHGQFTGPSLSRRRSSFGWRWQSAGVPASNLRT